MSNVELYKASVQGDGETIVLLGSVDGEPVAAYAWVSATEAHPVDDTRDEAGHRLSDKMRPMGPAEREEYFRAQLLAAVRPKPVELAGVAVNPMPEEMASAFDGI